MECFSLQSYNIFCDSPNISQEKFTQSEIFLAHHKSILALRPLPHPLSLTYPPLKGIGREIGGGGCPTAKPNLLAVFLPIPLRGIGRNTTANKKTTAPTSRHPGRVLAPCLPPSKSSEHVQKGSARSLAARHVQGELALSAQLGQFTHLPPASPSFSKNFILTNF